MVGWVYEANRDKKKSAQRDLDKFYADDLIDDLGKTRDAEIKALQDRIDAWDLYLKNLEYNMKEQERMHNLHILEELMNANGEEEIRDRITKDMETFNADALKNYKDYNTIFYDELIVPYRKNLETLQGLVETQHQLLNPNLSLGINNGLTISELAGGQGLTNFLDRPYDANRDYTADIMSYIAQGNLPYSELQSLIAKMEMKAEDLGITTTFTREELEDMWRRSNSSYDKTSSTYDIETNGNKTYVHGSGSNGYVGADKNTVDKSVKEWERQMAANSAAWHTASTQAEKDRLHEMNVQLQSNIAKAQGKDYEFDSGSGKWSQKKGYSTGLKAGPVTYTGLAMLHGTPSAPEYVLNSDQAYNLLSTLGAGRLPETVKKNSESGTQYIVQGDVVLENCDNPAEFWQQVTVAMGNRWNVTKNNKG